MSRSVFFLSDAHLGAEEPEKEKLKEDKLIAQLDKHPVAHVRVREELLGEGVGL